MKVTEIKESGSNNILLWAISNGADIKSDIPLQNMINDELFYLVTIEGVDLFELFRLTQTFRDELRIITEHVAAAPSMKDLVDKFPGSFHDPDDESKSMPLAEVAEHAITGFSNIVLQMQNDPDIAMGASKMFIPMIMRRYDIQIPISFTDVISSFRSTEAANKVFNSQYPNTLAQLVDDPVNDVINMINIVFVKLTGIIKMNNRLERYIDHIKFSALKNVSNNKAYKIYMLGFHKFNPISRGVTKFSLFNANTETIGDTLARLGKINSPLEIDFAVQLPIQLMQVLENMFGPDMLKISYESSMSSIISEGLMFNDFVAPETESQEDESDEQITDRVNSVSAYRVRLTESNQFALNAIYQLTNDPESDVSSAFAILPSIYTTKAVITIKADDIASMMSVCHDTNLTEMFQSISQLCRSILNDINSSMK